MRTDGNTDIHDEVNSRFPQLLRERAQEWFQMLALSAAVHLAQQKPASVTTEISCAGPGDGREGWTDKLNSA